RAGEGEFAFAPAEGTRPRGARRALARPGTAGGRGAFITKTKRISDDRSRRRGRAPDTFAAPPAREEFGGGDGIARGQRGGKVTLITFSYPHSHCSLISRFAARRQPPSPGLHRGGRFRTGIRRKALIGGFLSRLPPHLKGAQVGHVGGSAEQHLVG